MKGPQLRPTLPAGGLRLDLNPPVSCRPDPWGRLEERIWAAPLTTVPDATATPIQVQANEPGTLLTNGLTVALALENGLANLQTRYGNLPAGISQFNALGANNFQNPANVVLPSSWDPGYERCLDGLPTFQFAINSTLQMQVEANPGGQMQAAVAVPFNPAGAKLIQRPPLKQRRKTGTTVAGVASGVVTPVQFQAPEDGYYELHSLEVKAVGPAGAAPIPYDRTGMAIITSYIAQAFDGGVDIVRGIVGGGLDRAVSAMNFHPESRYCYGLPAPKMTQGATFTLQLVHFSGVNTDFQVDMYYRPIRQYGDACPPPRDACGRCR